MPYPTVAEFEELLLARPLDGIVREFVFAPDPFVFADAPDSLPLLRRHLSEALGVAATSIAIIGSGQIGFSLSPDNFGRQFSDDSDIDVLVVDEAIFDGLWLTLLKWQYPRRLSRLAGADQEWASFRRKDVYWGWFRPDMIRFEGLSFPEVLKPLRDMSARWFNAFRSLSENAEFVRRDFHGRLYRTWDHAVLYHVDGLRQIADGIRAKRGV